MFCCVLYTTLCCFRLPPLAAAAKKYLDWYLWVLHHLSLRRGEDHSPKTTQHRQLHRLHLLAPEKAPIQETAPGPVRGQALKPALIWTVPKRLMSNQDDEEILSAFKKLNISLQKMHVWYLDVHRIVSWNILSYFCTLETQYSVQRTLKLKINL